MVASLLIYQPNVCIIEEAFFSKVSTSDGLPNFFALSGPANERASLRHQLVDFVSWYVGQTGEGLLTEAASQLLTIGRASLGPSDGHVCDVSGRSSLKRFHCHFLLFVRRY